MSMPDLWSPDAMVPKRTGMFPLARRVAVVPKARIPDLVPSYPETFFPFRDINVYYESGDESMSPADIVDSVCLAYGFTRSELTGCKRSHKYLPARREAARRLRDIGLSSPDIGKVLKRDHTTVLYMLGNLRKSKGRWG